MAHHFEKRIIVLIDNRICTSKVNLNALYHEFLDNGPIRTTSLVSESTFCIVLKTHTLYYIHTTFRKLLLRSSGEQIVF
jgi:hypothetical protein